MIGNDIVDIAEAKANSNWQHPRFLDKLFTTEEQQYINTSKDAFIAIWQLWSIKEAAYKLYTQMNPSRFYNPKAFKVNINNDFAIVKFKTFQCFVTTNITPNYIYAEARLEAQKEVSNIIEFQTKGVRAQSKLLRASLFEAIKSFGYNDSIDFKIIKNRFGIPTLKTKNKQYALSLTHHGKYGAYVYCEAPL